MGGMVAQVMALDTPGRLLSLISTSSCTGPAVGPHMPSLFGALKLNGIEGKYAVGAPDYLDGGSFDSIVEGKNHFYHHQLGEFTSSWEWHVKGEAAVAIAAAFTSRMHEL